MESDAFRIEPDVPCWSNAPLEDHKGNRLTEVGTPEFFERGTHTFFGDVHIHTNFSRCGYPNNMSVEDNLAYARETAGMDFCCIADHAEHMEDDQYAHYCSAIEAANAPGAFATIPGFEWACHTHPTHGHRNVMFRDRFGPILRGNDDRYNSPRKLSEAVLSQDQPAIAPRHHPTYINNWDNFQPDTEPVVEIFSSWGNSECESGSIQMSDDGRRGPWPGNYVQDGLARGYRLGFLGGGDAHSIKPGSNGVTAVIAPDRTREAIFDAICSRRCYATTGPRILLDFYVNGYPMGGVVKVPAARWTEIFPLRVSCGAIGTANLRKIEIVENNRVVFTQHRRRGPSNQMAFSVQRTQVDYYWRYFYARLTQEDGEMAWSSPVWFVYEEDVAL